MTRLPKYYESGMMDINPKWSKIPKICPKNVIFVNLYPMIILNPIDIQLYIEIGLKEDKLLLIDVKRKMKHSHGI